MPLTPDEIRDYLLDELSPGRRAAVEELLRADPVARAELERQRSLLEALHSLPQAEVPRRLVLVPGSRPALPATGPSWLGVPPGLPRAAIAAVIAILIAIGIWASGPTLSRHAAGWTIAFGSAASQPPEWTEAGLREVLREELARSDARWRLALLEVSQSAAGAEWVRSEFDALRRELAEAHEDAVAGYEFVNAKHELLKRQLLEFDLAAASEVQP
jgi:anti-sigma factor RsiW